MVTIEISHSRDYSNSIHFNHDCVKQRSGDLQPVRTSQIKYPANNHVLSVTAYGSNRAKAKQSESETERKKRSNRAKDEWTIPLKCDTTHSLSRGHAGNKQMRQIYIPLEFTFPKSLYNQHN